MPRRQRLRRGVGDAAPVPRGAAGLDLGGLGQRHEPRRAARARALAALAGGVPARGRAGRRAPTRAWTRTSTSSRGSSPTPPRSRSRARRVVESMALCLQGSLLVRHGPAGRGRRLLRLAPGGDGGPGVRHAARRAPTSRRSSSAAARRSRATRARGRTAQRPLGAYHGALMPRTQELPACAHLRHPHRRRRSAGSSSCSS